MLRRVQPLFLGDRTGGQWLLGPALGAAPRQGRVGVDGYRRGSGSGGLLGYGRHRFPFCLHMFRALVCCWKTKKKKKREEGIKKGCSPQGIIIVLPN